MKFTICDEATGRVLFAGTAHDPHAMAETGQVVIEDECLEGGWVQDGLHQAMPAQPEEHCVFDWVSKQWTDPRTLQDLRDARWGVIKAARTAAEFGGFIWDGSSFDSDALSQSRIQGAIQLASLVPGRDLDWTLADNSVRTLGDEDIAAVGVALGTHVAAQHTKARALRTALEAATTPSAIAAIVW